MEVNPRGRGRSTLRLVTAKQSTLIGVLARRHGIEHDVLDRYVREQFGHGVASLAVGQASELIDRMQAWQAPPPEIHRMRGQLDLFAIGGDV